MSHVKPLVLGLVSGAVCSVVIAAGQPRPSEGLYSVAQADAGRQAYGANCSSCHAEKLSGQSAPPLVGPAFMSNWERRSIGDLVTLIQSSMPPSGRAG